MGKVCVVYHSGYGHTKVQADAVADGARSVPATEVHLIPVEHIDFNWEHLHGADALIFGTPTYMGTVSAEFKAFMDKTRCSGRTSRRRTNWPPPSLIQVASTETNSTRWFR